MRFKQILSLLIICSILIIPSGCSFKKDIDRTGRVNMVSRVKGEHIQYYSHGTWNNHFWCGVNLGATNPGHFPGELNPTYDDYRRWFEQMTDLGIDLVRIYTILPPDFYRALVDHNQSAKNKLWLVQGIWSPEDELISRQNAYLSSINQEFNNEIDNAVRAVYGRGEIPPSPGKAGGDYSSSAAPYLLAWIVGSEWDPQMAENTNRLNSEHKIYNGQYFRTKSKASPFEVWLVQKLERLAADENVLGWQHPISFVNWVTTDPLSHPDEPIAQEDLVSVDPMHVAATQAWQAGYFAAYHVYPYYPDSLRYQPDYQNAEDPYQAYISQLRKHHTEMPLVIAEFGVPSSRGMAHRGPLSRNQGMHTEQEQGKMDVAMLKAIKNTGCTGGFLFEWHDEWFKCTWNTLGLEIPAERRPMWLNRLTNEENFGLLAVEPGENTVIFLDGRSNDWDEIDGLQKSRLADGTEIMAVSDEAYLYLACKKPDGWNWQNDQLYIGFDNQPGGNTYKNGLSLNFNQGLEFLLSINNPDDAVLQVTSSYDQYTYIYGSQKKSFPCNSVWEKENNGVFLPWKLCLSYRLYLPASKRTISYEDLDIGKLVYGKSNPSSPDYNSLADFYAGKNLLEIRIPWMMLGFTDPGTHQVWAYPYRTNLPNITTATSPGINIETIIAGKSNKTSTIELSLAYRWNNWDMPSYHERKKQSYYLLQSFIKNL